MRNLKENELKEIRGGFSIIAVIGISALITFLAGFLEGYVHPKKCGGE